jgi:hypothetical protein
MTQERSPSSSPPALTAFDRPAAAGTPSLVFSGGAARKSREDLGTHHEAAREVPIFKRTQVLVIGGGPAGTAAAIAAGRLGADVTLVERYNHLGGLSTGGLVLWIDRMTDWAGKLVIQGIGKELLGSLPAEGIAGPPPSKWGSTDKELAAYWALRTSAFHGIVTWSPTIDPEWLKWKSLELVTGAKVDLLLHAWAAAPIMDGNKVTGAILESKQGRVAITADVVIDTSGDGDMFAMAGAAYDADINQNDIHHCMNVSWLFGGVEMEQWIEFRSRHPDQFAKFMERGREAVGFFDRPFVSWRKDVALFMGPRMAGYSCLSIDDLTTVEIESRRLMVAHMEFYRAHAPGFAGAFLALSGPQMGSRHSRRLHGVESVTRSQWETGGVLATEIGVSPSLSPKFPNISVPYGSLVPDTVDGLLAAGKHLSCDMHSHSFLREIPQCWMTGHAAGAAAALAVQAGVQPRHVDIAALQGTLLKQGAYLRQQQFSRANAGEAASAV